MIGVDVRDLSATVSCIFDLKFFGHSNDVIYSYDVMLTALVVCYGWSHLMRLTAMMSYDVCKKIKILCVYKSTRMRKLRILSIFTLLHAHGPMAVAYHGLLRMYKIYFNVSIR